MKLQDIDVFVLCGGLGTRLRSTIGQTQKVMATVGREPFLNIILRALESQGFRRVILCVGYKAQSLQTYYQKNSLGLDIHFSVEKTPLGTGGALKNAKRFLKSPCVFVLNGDSYCPIDFKKVLAAQIRCKALATIVVSKAKDRRDYGIIILDSKNRVSAFLEKSQDVAFKKAFVNAGVYCFDRSVWKFMPSSKKFSLEKDLFPVLVKNKIYALPGTQKFIDIGTPERYQAAQKRLTLKG
jgi:NDP-sugar pyrophosphorylase family protein